MRIGRFHVLTDTTVQSRFDPAELALRAIAGGADTIQYRRKSGETRAMIEEARRVREVCHRRGVTFIVNDRVDVAIAADADGVHLGREDFPIRLARALLGPHRIIGGSAGTIEEAEAGWREGADYLGCGPVYATGTKPNAGAPAGARLIEAIRAAVPLPILGIGGITAENMAPVLEAGAWGVAVVAAVCASDDPEAAARAIREILDRRFSVRAPAGS